MSKLSITVLKLDTHVSEFILELEMSAVMLISSNQANRKTEPFMHTFDRRGREENRYTLQDVKTLGIKT